MIRAIENAKENEIQKRQHITYNKRVLKRDLDTKKVIEEKVFRVFGQNGKSMEQLIEENKKSQKNKRIEQSNDNLVENLTARCDFTLTDTKIVDGVAYFIVSFKPKNELPKAKNRNEKALDHSSGEILIEIDGLRIKKIHSWSTKSFWGEVFVWVSNYSVEIEQEEKFGIMVPKSMRVRYKIYLVNEELEYTYENHEDLRNNAAQNN